MAKSAARSTRSSRHGVEARDETADLGRPGVENVGVAGPRGGVNTAGTGRSEEDDRSDRSSSEDEEVEAPALSGLEEGPGTGSVDLVAGPVEVAGFPALRRCLPDNWL